MTLRKPWAMPRVGPVAWALLPSFVADAVRPDRKPETYRMHPTSYLDGLRGIASFIVFIYHYTEPNHGYFVPTYGLNAGRPSAFLQLPFVRAIYAGRPMVHIFFVISGFVLAYKPLKSIHQGAGGQEKCYAALASSTFRRPIRLFLPCVVSTFLIAILMQLGLAYAPEPSLWVALKKWVSGVFYKVCWPWDWDHEAWPPYDLHLWTIPIEFSHSLLLFLGIMATSRLYVRVRQAFFVAVMVYGLACGRWAMIEFFGGMVLAERHILRSMRTDAVLEDVRWTRRTARSTAKTIFQVFVIIAGLYVGGWPNVDADKTWGIAFLNSITPPSFLGGDMPQRLWFAVFAILIVWSCGELAMARRFLEGGFAQYCGRVSYAIYIVHGPILEMCQNRVIGLPHVAQKGQPGEAGFVPAIQGYGVKGIFGHDTPTQQMLSWFVALVALFPIVVWGSDLFWRFVDVPVVALGRTVENMCLGLDTSKEREGYAPM